LDAHSMLNQLQKASLYSWDTKIAALPGQFQSALEDSIKISAPKTASYTLPRTTIYNNAEIEEYVAKVKSDLESLLYESGSVILK